MKYKKLIKNWRVILLLVLLIASFFAISFNPATDGAAIRVVAKDSSADLAGINSPDSKVRPMDREVISVINGESVSSTDDYYRIVSNYSVNDTFVVKTNKATYTLVALPEYEYITLNETEVVIRQVFNETLNDTVNVSFDEAIIETNIIGVADLGLKVYSAPTSNLKKGLEVINFSDSKLKGL